MQVNHLQILAMKKRETKDTPLSFRVPASMKAALDKMARADRRSTSSLVELVLARFIEREIGKAK